MSAEALLRAAGVAASPALADALAARSDVLAMTARSRDSVLRPAEPGGLPHPLRAALAARVARLTGEDALAQDYAAGAGDSAALADPAEGADAPRMAAILAHVDLVGARPRDATPADIAALTAAGVAEADVVRLSQLIAFVAFEARLVAGLRLMGAA